MTAALALAAMLLDAGASPARSAIEQLADQVQAEVTAARPEPPVAVAVQAPSTALAESVDKAKSTKDAQDALAEPLEVFNTFFLDGKPFVGGDHPSIADIRWAATLEFLRSIDYEFPAWAEDFMSRMESTLGDAYSEPAGDVHGDNKGGVWHVVNSGGAQASTTKSPSTSGKADDYGYYYKP